MHTHSTSYVVQTNDSIYTVTPDENQSIYSWFKRLAHTIAFDDCTDERVLFITYEGKEIHYVGWQPGMLYEFADDEGNTIWSQAFPEWDH